MTTVSTKPYLVRAIYEWCIDQGFTPHLAVLVDENTRVPPGYARDGQIVLNIGPDATHQLLMGNDRVTFQGRFGGVAHSLSIPLQNVLAVYARENGQGMAFEPEPESDDDELTPVADEERTILEEVVLKNAEDDASEAPDSPEPPPTPPPAGGRARLKLVK